MEHNYKSLLFTLFTVTDNLPYGGCFEKNRSFRSEYN